MSAKSDPAGRLRKFLRVVADKDATIGERESAGRRLGELLVANPALAAGLLTVRAAPAPPPPKPQDVKRTMRRGARVVRKAGQSLGVPKVAAAGQAFLDLLDEWNAEDR